MTTPNADNCGIITNKNISMQFMGVETMLIEFTVGNFRSIAKKVTLSMIAAPIRSGSHATNLDTDNIIRINDKLSLLKSVVIYGANASGKSNILSALVT